MFKFIFGVVFFDIFRAFRHSSPSNEYIIIMIDLLSQLFIK